MCLILKQPETIVKGEQDFLLTLVPAVSVLSQQIFPLPQQLLPRPLQLLSLIPHQLEFFNQFFPLHEKKGGRVSRAF